MATLSRLLLVSVGAVLTAGSVVAVAGTASNSPFATKKPKAWEQPSPAPATYTPPAYQAAPQTGQYSAPAQNTVQSYRPPNYEYQGSATYQPPSQSSAAQSGTQGYGSNVQTRSETALAGGYYPGRQQAAQYAAPYAPQNPQYAQTNAYGQNANGQAQYTSPQPLRGSSKPSWANRLGLGNIETSVSGFGKIGLAAVEKSGADTGVEGIADFSLRAEASAITEGGLEYGAGVRVRAQRDRHRRGFGGRVGDCPASNAGCASTLVNGAARTVKGHTSQLYTDGPSDAKESEFTLEGAYLFLRSSYGDVVLGRDDGSAYLFSLGAPSLVAVNASNSSVDYTGLDSVKTVNDASGFAEKLAYTSPRLLGDTVGVGVQFGLSYAPNARACGVDYCVQKNGNLATDPFSPQINDVIEAGVSFDRKFDNGFGAELTASYARGSEQTGNAAFTDLSSYGVGLEFKYSDFVFGTSYLKSNNGFAGDGNYTAYDAGLTWKPSKWGFTASYGHANDDIVQLTSNQGVLAVSYDIGRFRLGSGVQYVKRTVPGITAGIVDEDTEDAAALFVEGAFKF